MYKTYKHSDNVNDVQYFMNQFQPSGNKFKKSVLKSVIDNSFNFLHDTDEQDQDNAKLSIEQIVLDNKNDIDFEKIFTVTYDIVNSKARPQKKHHKSFFMEMYECKSDDNDELNNLKKTLELLKNQHDNENGELPDLPDQLIQTIDDICDNGDIAFDTTGFKFQHSSEKNKKKPSNLESLHMTLCGLCFDNATVFTSYKNNSQFLHTLNFYMKKLLSRDNTEYEINEDKNIKKINDIVDKNIKINDIVEIKVNDIKYVGQVVSITKDKNNSMYKISVPCEEIDININRLDRAMFYVLGSIFSLSKMIIYMIMWGVYNIYCYINKIQSPSSFSCYVAVMLNMYKDFELSPNYRKGIRHCIQNKSSKILDFVNIILGNLTRFYSLISSSLTVIISYLLIITIKIVQITFIMIIKFFKSMFYIFKKYIIKCTDDDEEGKNDDEQGTDDDEEGTDDDEEGKNDDEQGKNRKNKKK